MDRADAPRPAPPARCRLASRRLARRRPDRSGRLGAIGAHGDGPRRSARTGARGGTAGRNGSRRRRGGPTRRSRRRRARPPRSPRAFRRPRRRSRRPRRGWRGSTTNAPIWRRGWQSAASRCCASPARCRRWRGARRSCRRWPPIRCARPSICAPCSKPRCPRSAAAPPCCARKSGLAGRSNARRGAWSRGCARTSGRWRRAARGWRRSRRASGSNRDVGAARRRARRTGRWRWPRRRATSMRWRAGSTKPPACAPNSPPCPPRSCVQQTVPGLPRRRAGLRNGHRASRRMPPPRASACRSSGRYARALGRASPTGAARRG